MRVRTEARREAILATAAAVFLELGYDRAGMAEIAARSGCSKVTLYGYFESKDELFLGVITHLLGREVGPLLDELASSGKQDPAAVLQRFGEQYLGITLAPEAIAVRRLIIAQVSDPALSKRFWELGPQRYLDGVESYLAAATREGQLAVEDPKLGALHLTALYEAETSGAGLYADGTPFTRKFIKSIVARAVDVFLQMYGEKRQRVTAPSHG